MEPCSGARRKLKPRCIVKSTPSRWPAIHAYVFTAITRFATCSKHRIPPRLEHTPCKFAPLLHNPEGGHRSNTYWDVCGFFVREMCNVLLCKSTTSRVSP